jgi:hypothetical protein
MGRAMLIVVLLMGTIYAGIVSGLQNRILFLPEIVSRNIITKQAENVSDYALRLAIRDGNYLRSTQMAEYDTSSTVYTYTGQNEYVVQDSRIDSLTFIFESATGSGDDLIKRYLATSYVTGELMGHTIGYQAKVAYELTTAVDFENIYYNYYSMDDVPWKDLINDSSENGNDAVRVGKNLLSLPHGVNGGRYACFGKRGSNEATYMYFEESPVSVEQTCTLSTWARIAKGRDYMTLLWLPPDITDPDYTGAYSGMNFYRRPTAAIIYDKPNIVFIANTVDGEQLQINHPIPVNYAINQMHKDDWSHYSMTYDNGIMKAYVGGILVGTQTATNYPVDMVRNYGFYLGREHLASGLTNNFEGNLDEVGFSPYVLSTDNLFDYYRSISTPTKILYFRD